MVMPRENASTALLDIQSPPARRLRRCGLRLPVASQIVVPSSAGDEASGQIPRDARDDKPKAGRCPVAVIVTRCRDGRPGARDCFRRDARLELPHADYAQACLPRAIPSPAPCSGAVH
jgi:hypothetical protein